MLHDLEMLGGIWQSALNLPIELIRKFSPDTLSVMEFKSQKEVGIASKIYDKYPFLGENIKDSWNIDFGNELHMTKFSSLLIPMNDIPDKQEIGEKYLCLYEGKVMHQFSHNFSEPRFCVPKIEWLKQISGSKNKGFDFKKYRLVIRYQARSTDERTLITTIIPKDCLCGHSLVVQRASSEISAREQIFLSSLLNSFCQDYVLRLKVSANINMYHIKQLAIPRTTRGNWYFDSITDRAIRLICTTPEFADIWKEITGSEWSLQNGVTDNNKRLQLRAEIDALVAHLFSLKKDEFEYILSTFPLVAKEIKEKTFEEFIKMEKSGFKIDNLE
jgi:hypothetical protein